MASVEQTHMEGAGAVTDRVEEAPEAAIACPEQAQAEPAMPVATADREEERPGEQQDEVAAPEKQASTEETQLEMELDAAQGRKTPAMEAQVREAKDEELPGEAPQAVGDEKVQVEPNVAEADKAQDLEITAMEAQAGEAKAEGLQKEEPQAMEAEEVKIEPNIAEADKTQDGERPIMEEPDAVAKADGLQDEGAQAMEAEEGQAQDREVPGDKVQDCDTPVKEVQVGEAEAKELQDAVAQAMDVDAVPAEPQTVDADKVEPKLVQTKTRKRAAGKELPGLEVMAAKIKRLNAEADQAEAAIADEVKKLEELQARIAAMRADAEAKRAAAQRASQEYLKKQCEASIAHLEACVPKRPPNPWVVFRNENTVRGKSALEQQKEIAEKWAKLDPEEKKKYVARYDEENRKFKEWSTSDEGRRNIRERTELRRKCQAESAEELNKAIVAAESCPTDGAPMHTPTKRTKDAQQEETPTQGRVVKQRRVASVRASPPTKGPVLDEEVLEEAGKVNLAEQLRNLAARPDVLALGRSSQELWDALRAHNGMVNAAKHALLSA